MPSVAPVTAPVTLPQAVRPCFVARVGGLPANAIEALQAPRTMTMIGELHAVEETLLRERESVSECLFAVIASCTERGARNRLLGARRNLYNLRAPSSKEWKVLSQNLSPVSLEEVRQFAALIAQRDEQRTQIEALYVEESCNARAWFQQAVQGEDFRKGLLVSSQSLFDNLSKYSSAAASRVGGRLERIERGLLRYFTRAAMKATPFSTFCSVLPGVMEPVDTVGRVALKGEPEAKRGAVRLNKALHAVLWRRLKEHPDIRPLLNVALNPTVVGSHQLRFLTNLRGNEVFQSVAGNEALDTILPVLRDHPDIRLGDLGTMLVRHPSIATSESNAIGYLERLLKIGLLVFRSSVADQEIDWDVSLQQMLLVIDHDNAREVVALLERLREMVQHYATAGSSGRAALLREMGSIVENYAQSGAVFGAGGRMLPLHEDVTADAAVHLECDDNMARALEDLVDLVQLLLPIALPRAEMMAMRHFFQRHYGADAEPVPLMRFYEDFYRYHLKAHIAKEQLLRRGGVAALKGYNLQNPFGLPEIADVATRVRELRSLIATRWALKPDCEEIVLRRDELAGILGNFVAHENQEHRELSVAAFCQVIPRTSGESARIVVQKPFVAGNGKYFSRFLYLLPEEFYRAVIEDNRSTNGVRHAEICGDSDFNANLHPPLLPWTISYPTNETAVPEGQLQCVDLEVRPDCDNQSALQLIHRPSMQVVVPADLGFLNTLLRPALYRLLSRFADFSGVVFPLPETVAESTSGESGSTRLRSEPANRSVMPSPGVVYRPRISYEGRVVVARRQWSIPAQFFPRQRPDEDAANHFIRVQEWRSTYGIPPQVYVRLVPHYERGLVGTSGESTGTGAGIQDSDGDPVGPLHDAGVEGGVGEATEGTYERRAGEREESNTESTRQSSDIAVSGRDSPVSNRKKKDPRNPFGRDWSKPQFIDFTSPSLVRLFERLPASLVKYTVILEERLPGAESLPTHEGNQYTTEVILQLTVKSHPGVEALRTKLGTGDV